MQQMLFQMRRVRVAAAVTKRGKKREQRLPLLRRPDALMLLSRHTILGACADDA